MCKKLTGRQVNKGKQEGHDDMTSNLLTEYVIVKNKLLHGP